MAWGADRSPGPWPRRGRGDLRRVAAVFIVAGLLLAAGLRLVIGAVPGLPSP
ncbi:MAG: hypothetical protein M3Q27_08235 [Actinomycetota bacterium]|nr:hypothetical protein [Actinomycetota bacterium]